MERLPGSRRQSRPRHGFKRFPQREAERPDKNESVFDMFGGFLVADELALPVEGIAERRLA